MIGNFKANDFVVAGSDDRSLVIHIAQSLQFSLTDRSPQGSDYMSCPQVLETRSDALDSSIPAPLISDFRTAWSYL